MGAGALPAEDGWFDPSALHKFLAGEAGDCGLVVFALSGTAFQRCALVRFAEALREFPDALAFYGDLAYRDEDNGLWPLALSAFDYERMLEQGYCTFLFAVPRAALESALSVFARAEAGGARQSPRAQAFPSTIASPSSASSRSLFPTPRSAAASSTFPGSSAPSRLSTSRPCAAPARRDRRPSCRARRCGRRHPRRRYAVPGGPRAAPPGRATTAIVIPTRNRLDLLEPCLEFIRPGAARLGAGIVIVDNDSSDPDTLVSSPRSMARHAACPARARPVQFLPPQQSSPPAALGADHLCLLNNDVQAQDADWLAELAGRLAEPDVGAVGALLAWPSGIVQHGGVVLGPHLAATHAFNDRMSDDPGYTDLLRVAHEGSAVTAACLLTRRADYLAVGGMDELRFPINFNDVDYCLKLRAAGKAHRLHAARSSRPPRIRRRAAKAATGSNCCGGRSPTCRRGGSRCSWTTRSTARCCRSIRSRLGARLAAARVC